MRITKSLIIIPISQIYFVNHFYFQKIKRHSKLSLQITYSNYFIYIIYIFLSKVKVKKPKFLHTQIIPA